MGVSKVTLNGVTLMDVTDKTVDTDNLLAGNSALRNDGESITGAVVTASPSDASPAMDGTASAGSATTYSRGDHVHPSDTNKANINNPSFTGIPTAPTASKGTDTTQIATTAFVQSAITDINYPVTSVNSKTGTVVLTASDVGALPDSTTIPQGTVTSVRVQATSPVQSSTNTAQSTTLNTTISLADSYGDTKNPYAAKAKNTVLAGPSTGTATAPSFRTLEADDIPSLTVSKISDFPSTMTPSSHSHGNITNAGDITTTATIANGDRLVINDESASKITNSSITFGTSETTYLTNKGTWKTPDYPVTSVNTKTGAVSLTASDVGALPDTTEVPTATSDLTNDSGFITSSDIPVTSVNTKTGAVSLSASDVGALPDSTDVTKWNGVELSTVVQNVNTLYYVPVKASSEVGNGTASWMKATPTPTNYAIAKYDGSSYLYSTTPAASDNSTKVATTAYVDSAINELGSLLTFKGVVATTGDLPGSGNDIGDVWVVSEDNSEHVWTGEAWERLGPTIDLSGYVPTSRTINNKALSTDITLSASDVGALPSTTDLSVYMQKGVDYVTAGQASGSTLGDYATAEGYNTTATANYSHAEGNNTTASGNCSHAEGRYTTASGMQSHAEGNNTVAQRRSQHVFGEYNILDTTGSSTNVKGTYVEIVGNGTSSSARSNARTLDWSGNEVLAGKLTVGAGPTNNMDVATKQYVDGAIPSVPTGSSTSPKMDGTATVGTETSYARGDHIHPTDTTRQAKITASGILKGDGNGAVTSAAAGTDYVALPEVFTVTLTFSNNTLTADKTYSQIQAAIAAGQELILRKGEFTGRIHYYIANAGAVFTSGGYTGAGPTQVIWSVDPQDTWTESVSQATCASIGAQPTITTSGILKGNGSGGISAAVVRNNTATSGAVTADTALITSNTLRYAINRTTSVAAADTEYTTIMARGMGLRNADTNPSLNGAINWTYG